MPLPRTSDDEARGRAERAAEWAVRLREDATLRERQEEFAAWLAADPRNLEALEEIIDAWRTVDQYSTSAQVMAMREAALAEGRRALSRRHTPFSSRRLGSIAAALLLMVMAIGLWRWLVPQTYATGVGERRVVMLSDGSRISLDAATMVKVAYSRDRRQLWLEHGRAKFDVAKNPLRPFSVSAADKVVVAVGTSFSVERIDHQVRVVLYEGHVAVLESAGGANPYQLDIAPKGVPAGNLLTAGKELVLPVASLHEVRFEPASVGPIDLERSLSWESGQLVFDDEPLAIAIARMNRYAARPLVIVDPAIARLRISGVFRAGDTHALVEGLGAAFGVQAREEPDRIVLSASREARASPHAN
jgi:transmembrane sensor